MEDFRKFSVVDLSVCLDEGFPLTWPGMPALQKRTINWYERVTGSHGQVLVPSMGAFYSQALSLDEHTGTHVDFPSHNIPSSRSGLPNSGPAGDARGDEYPLENLCGPAAVVDVRSLLDQSLPGNSPAITPEILREWEKDNGQINSGDIVLLNSGYCDRYFSPLPGGNRMFEPVTTAQVPGWPAPSPAALEFLHQRGVRHVGVATPSIGAVEDLGAAHLAGLSRGMSFTEMLVNLGAVPTRGAWFFMLPLRIAAQSGGPGRAIALVPKVN
jgi:kynurenine formamidase